MELLKLNKHGAIGLLHMLWWWACDYAPTGDLTDYAASQIAKSVEWTGDPHRLVTSLITSKFITEKDGKRQIHDWPEFRLHYDFLMQRKERQRQQIRKRVKRFREKMRNPPVTQSNAATVPNQPYQPNHTNQTTHPGFMDFWRTYPRKVGKVAAEKAWKKLAPPHDLVGVILAALEQQRTWPQWVKDSGQFIPHPATWLNGQRWDDAPPDELRRAERSVAEDLTPAQRQRLKTLTAGIGKSG